MSSLNHKEQFINRQFLKIPTTLLVSNSPIIPRWPISSSKHQVGKAACEKRRKQCIGRGPEFAIFLGRIILGEIDYE